MIKFGTDGWRDIIGEDFTYENVRKVAHAHALYLLGGGAKRVVVGFDTRFQGEGFARVAAETMAAVGLEVLLSKTYLPTPALSFAVKHFGAGGGVMISASHNPPEYNGYKIKGAYGGSATPEIISGIEKVLEQHLETGVDVPKSTAALERFDIRKAYFEQLDSVLDLELLRTYKGVMYFDPMGGAGAGWLEGFVRHAKLLLELRPLHAVPHPMFYGVNPEPVPQNLASLMAILKTEASPVFGAVTDGDADRVGAVTAGGHFFNSHKIFALLIQNMYARGLRGRVVNTVSGSGLIEKLCQKWNLELFTTPVGFKYITDAFLDGEINPEKAVLVGGEESGGMAVMGHLPERDGILSSLLLLESVVRTGKGLDQQFAELEDLAGFKHFYDRRDLHLSSGFDKLGFLQEAHTWTEVAGFAVVGVISVDGVKLMLEPLSASDRSDARSESGQSGGFAMLRASGTEPLLRIYVEAQSAEALKSILDWVVERVLEADEKGRR